MTVESNYWIAIVTLSDWLNNLAPVCQPMRRETKSNCDLHTPISPALSRLHVIASNSDWLIALSAPLVIGLE